MSNVSQHTPGMTDATDQVSYTTEFDNNGGSSPVYIGQALPGTATSVAKWRIKKLTYDGSGNILSTTYANGVATFSNIYDNRASYTYS